MASPRYQSAGSALPVSSISGSAHNRRTHPGSARCHSLGDERQTRLSMTEKWLCRSEGRLLRKFQVRFGAVLKRRIRVSRDNRGVQASGSPADDTLCVTMTAVVGAAIEGRGL